MADYMRFLYRMIAEIITIGDELLLGQVVDTNSAWMGLQLADIGIRINRRIAVADKKSEIIQAINESFFRCDLLLLTGGLGPTRDDLTKDALCEYYQCGLRQDEQVMNHLIQLFERRGRTLLDSNRQQAELPEKCSTLFNPNGTAPGMLFDIDGKVLISMPGVPGEMKDIMTEQVLPWLKKRFITGSLIHRTMLTAGIPESLLSARLSDFENTLPSHISLAYLPSYSSVRLRLTGEGDNELSLQSEIDTLFNELKTKVEGHLVAEMDVDLPGALTQQLISQGLTISIAESCTGGFITNQLIQNPGVSAVMKGGLVTYSNEIKNKELGVSMDIFSTVGAVSEACAQAMVKGIREKFDTDLAISTTGIAGPDGGTEEKPVGTVYIGTATRNSTLVKKYHLPGSRQVFMQRVCITALNQLRGML